MYDIITIGSATRDVFLISQALHPHKTKDALTHIEACLPFGAKINVDSLHFDTGGGATNNAVTFARLGRFKTAALCRIGQDSAGHDISQALKHDKVDTALVQTAYKELTAYSAILSPGGEVGERTILVYRGASRAIEHAKIPWPKLQTRWFYVSSLAGDLALLKKILTYAKKIGAQVVFNPGGQELTHPTFKSVIASTAKQSLRFLILNREEAAKFTGLPFEKTHELLKALARFAQAVVMTDGPKGAYAVTRDVILRAKPEGSRTNVRTSHAREILRSAQNDKIKLYYIPSVGHKPKNITGAGDAFGSGFITGWIKSKGDLKEALRVGSYNADSVVQHFGAKVGILRKYPSHVQLNKLPIREIKL